MKKSFQSVLAILIFLAACSYVQSPVDRALAEEGQPANPQKKPALPPGFVLEPTFDSIKVGVLDQKCAVCHQPGGKAEDVPLLTREDLLNSNEKIVVPGRADESLLVQVLLPSARRFMPPKKSKIDPVSESEIDVIRHWINRGAVD